MAATVSTGYFPYRGLARQHHGVRAVQHGVRYVGDLRAGRNGAVDHGFHHLRRRDDQLVLLPRLPDHPLLQTRHDGLAHLHGQIAARHHDAIGRIEYFAQRGDRFGALDLRHRERAPARLLHEIVRPADIVSRARKRYAQKIGLERRRRLDVLHVLGSKRRRGQATALAIDSLVVGERPALLDDRGNARALHEETPSTIRPSSSRSVSPGRTSFGRF
jgi:hypothetical protein